MARIQIPTIGVDLPVYHGTSDETLLRGIGHLQGTSLPVGGVNTHSVLTGHRGLARILQAVAIGVAPHVVADRDQQHEAGVEGRVRDRAAGA